MQDTCFLVHDTNSAIKLWPIGNVNLYVNFCAKVKTLGTERFKGLTYRPSVGNKKRVLLDIGGGV